MKISPFIFLAVLCFFISPVNCIEISVNDLHYVAHGVVPSGNGYLGNPDEILLMASDKNITAYDTIGGTLSVNQIMNFPYDVTGIYSTSDWIYVVLVDGSAYKIETSISPRDFGDLSFTGESRNGYYLGDFSTGTTYYNNRIIVDDNGDIFIYSAQDAIIYKVNGETYTSSTFVSNSVINAISIGQGTDQIQLAIYNDALYISVSDAGVDLDIYRFTATDTYTKVYDNVITSVNGYETYLFPLDNGNFVLGEGKTGTITTLIEYNGTASLGNIYSASGYYAASNDNGNVIVKPNGIIAFAATAQDKVVTFNTISGAGGVISGETGTTPPEITYNSKSVNAEYEKYYNQTNVNFKWSLAIDDDFIDTYNSVYSEPIYNRYYWKIELFSPDNIFINSYIIPTNWKYQSYTLGIFGKGDYVNSGNVNFNNIVGNGTYTVKIYELNRITGAKAFLDSDTFIILSQTNPSTSGSVSETSGESAAYKFLNSPYLVAIIVIGIVGFQFGRGRDGNINGTAMIVLIPLAVGLCCLMGILPMWILYVMVLCIIAFVAVKMSTGGS